MVALFLHHGTGSMDRYRKQWYCSTASNLRWCNAFILSRDKETECRRQNGKQPYSAQLSPNWLVRRRSRLSLSPTTAYGHGTMIFLAMMRDCVHLLTEHSTLQPLLPTSRSYRTFLPRAHPSTYAIVPATPRCSWQQALG
jgi:hypothetical protein